MDKCQRCKTKDACLQCMNCESFRNLCSRCDSYIHSLPTKTNHVRIPGNSQTIDLSQTPIVSENTIPERQKVEKESTQLPPEPVTTSNSILDSKFYYSNNYSRDYLNEIKNVFRKEKNELEFKNKTLQNNLDKLKLSFTEQMNNVTSELEQIQKNNTITIGALKENYEQKIAQLQNDHLIEVESLRNDIMLLQKKEADQNEMNITRQNDNDKIIAELNEKLANMQDMLNKKNEENFKLKNSFDVMMSQNESMLKDQRDKITAEYENKINVIVTDVENTKDKLLKLVDDREIDVKNLMDTNKSEISKLNEEIQKLREEVECHKVNLIKVRDERDFYRNQLEEAKKNENNFICDNQMQVNEIRRLDNENKKLLSENDDLKVQLSKLDKLIYGKIRPNFKY